MKLPSFFTLLLAATFQAKLGTAAAHAHDSLINSNALAPAVKQDTHSIFGQGSKLPGRSLQQDDWTQIQKITDNGSGSTYSNQYFGLAMGINGDTAIISQRAGTGRAMIYVRDTVTRLWSFHSELVRNDPVQGDYFGNDVAISGDTAIVGAYNAAGGGAAYIFTRSGTTWTQHSRLAAPASGQQFGSAVAIEGDTALIGARYDHENGQYNGAAYIFTRDPSTDVWSVDQKLMASAPTVGDEFGATVAMHGETVVIGAGRNDGYSGGGLYDIGAAFVYVKNATSQWEEQAILQPDGLASGDNFGGVMDGSSISIYENTVVIGIHQDNGQNPGAAYVYDRDPANQWSLTTTLLASDGANGDKFGFSVGAYGNTAVIGAIHDNDAGTRSGAVYVYTRDAATNQWGSEQKIVPADLTSWKDLGWAVAIDGNTTFLDSNYGSDGIWVYEGPASAPEPTSEPTNAPTAAPTASPTAEPTSEPTNAPTAAPTLEAAWDVSFLDLVANFTAASTEELSLTYEVGKGRTVEWAVYKDCMDKETITDITLEPVDSITDINQTHELLTLKYDINKTEVATSSIWNETLDKIEFCQVVSQVVPAFESTPKLVIKTDEREIDIDFDLSVNYTTNTSLAAGDIENADAATAVSSSVEACQCTETDVVCTNEPLAPNSELFVCVKSIDDAIDVDELVSMIISQTGQNPFTVVNEKNVINPAITSLESVSNKAVRVATRVPSNLFNFAAGEVITISGVINMKLVGSGRKLRALVGEATSNIDGDEEAAYELKIDVKGEADLALEDEVPIGNSGSTKAKELVAALGMAALSAYLML